MSLFRARRVVVSSWSTFFGGGQPRRHDGTTTQRTQRTQRGAARRAASPARGAREGAREEKRFGRRGSPLGAEADLDCGKKGFWPRREALGATTPRDNTASGERGEVSPEYVAPVSRPACRYGWPDSALHLTGSTVQRACLENTRDQRRARPGRRNLCH